MDPVTLGLAFANTQGGAALLGGVGKGLTSSTPAGPSNATSAAYGSGLDGSGWSINFAGVQNAGSNQDKSGGVPGIGASGIAGSIPWYVWALVAGAVVWRLKSSRR